jgi:hypothetical protein
MGENGMGYGRFCCDFARPYSDMDPDTGPNAGAAS